MRYPDTGEHGGVYIWESEESLLEWRQTSLAETLAETYKVEGEPNSEMLEVVLVLRRGEAPD